MDSPASLHPTFAPPDRKYIKCDAKDCGLVSGQLRCSRCRGFYYCSKTCQIKHWPEHKSYCRDVKTLKEIFREPERFDCDAVPVDMTHKVKVVAAEMTCGICLEETMEKPYALSNCQHVFCYPCLQAYQSKCKQANQPLRCPFCRADTEDVQKRHCESAFLYMCKAERKPESSVERKELLQIAISELEQVSKDDMGLYIDMIGTKMCTFDLLGDHESVLTLIDELLTLDNTARESSSNYVTTMSPKSRIATFLQRGETYESMEKWEKALQSYKETLLEIERLETLLEIERHGYQVSRPYRRSVLINSSRCLYHLKNFDEAISSGETAIQMNRHYRGVHKYVALSYKGKGDLETAIKLMSQAVLYETPWDEENIYQAKVLLDELIKSSDNKSSAA